MTERIRSAFDRLITQLRLMTELEARRRGWMSTEGIDMSVRVLIGMVMGMSSHGWLLLPDGDPEAVEADVIEGMIKLGLWGMTRMRAGATRARGRSGGRGHLRHPRVSWRIGTGSLRCAWLTTLSHSRHEVSVGRNETKLTAANPA